MYSPRRSYGSPPPELSNNPFIDHPSNALARFPDISGSSDLSGGGSQYAPWLQPSGSSLAPNMTGYGPQSTSLEYSGGYQQQQQMQPQQTAWNGSTSGSYGQPQQQGYASQAPQMSGPFQPSSSFGQQLASQVNSVYTGMPQQQPPMQQQYSGYPTSPQYSGGYQAGFAPQQSNQYLAEFDPYGQLPSSFGATTPSGNGQYKQLHPREYVQQHKAELEAWDSYAWKQVQNAFDALKEAWSTRKREIEARGRAMGGTGLFGGGYGGMYGQAQEYARLESLSKEASSNFDSVAASAFQMQEAYSGYRQSGDLASKRRVRESINAALTSLPDWPPQQF